MKNDVVDIMLLDKDVRKEIEIIEDDKISKGDYKKVQSDEKKEKLAHMMVYDNMKVEDMIRSLGVCKTTYYKWSNSPEIANRVNQLCKAKALKVKGFYNKYAEEATKVLLDVMRKSKDEKTRMNVAKYILDGSDVSSDKIKTNKTIELNTVITQEKSMQGKDISRILDNVIDIK